MAFIEDPFQTYEKWTTNLVFLEIITIIKLLFSGFSKNYKLYYGKRMSKLRKRDKSEEFEGYISIEGDNDHEVDDNDEVFLQVRAIVFCICI